MDPKRVSRRPIPHITALVKETPLNKGYVVEDPSSFAYYAQDPHGWQGPQVPPKAPKDAMMMSSSFVESTGSSAEAAAATHRTRRGLKRLTYALKWFVVMVVVGAVVAIPMIVLRQSVNVDESGSPNDVLQRYFDQQYQNLAFWISAWLLTSWIAGCLFHLVALAFPYCFRWFAKYLNPAHRRYWRVFYAMKWPITLLGAVVSSYVAFAVLIYYNEDMTAFYDFDAINNITRTTNSTGDSSIHLNATSFDDSGKQTVTQAQDILSDVLFNVILWTILYFLEKCVIVYISVHFHYRSHFRNLKNGKRTLLALATLYEASVYLCPLYGNAFRAEDTIIHTARESSDGKIRFGGKLSSAASTGGMHFSSAIGHLVSSDENSHWFHPHSSYAIVSRALNHPTSAAALAKRIWVSLASHGSDTLTVQDIAAALGPHRYQEAARIFELLDENENGDIRLNELIPSVVEIGAVRRDIYSGMHDIDHALNTFDWILCLILAIAMIFFILISWVPAIKNLRDNLALIVVGGAFIVGRIGHEFFSGVIFIFFKHAFDIADHVKLYNGSETQHVACIVRRISLLYVVFERVDNGMTVQMPNERLNIKRIENVTRSGLNREVIDLPIDFNTTFKDIELLRKELTAFVTRKENSRDYRPQLSVRIKSICDMTRMELQCTFWHKSNWKDEDLRAARSSKFLCALIAAARKVPIGKPGGNGAKTGDEGKPSYAVMISEAAADQKRAEEKSKQAAKRMDYVEPADEEPMSGSRSSEATETSEARRRRLQALREEAEQKAANKLQAEQEKQVEIEALETFMETPVATEIRDPLASAGEPAPLRRNDTGSFSFLSGRERGSRRTAVGPGQDTPFYSP